MLVLLYTFDLFSFNIQLNLLADAVEKKKGNFKACFQRFVFSTWGNNFLVHDLVYKNSHTRDSGLGFPKCNARVNRKQTLNAKKSIRWGN